MIDHIGDVPVIRHGGSMAGSKTNSQRARATGGPRQSRSGCQTRAQLSSSALDDLAVVTDSGATTFAFGEWKSKAASRNSDDGTVPSSPIDSGKMESSSWSPAAPAGGSWS